MTDPNSLNMSTFADHIIAVANEHVINVTSMHLQKVMYFSLKYALRHLCGWQAYTFHRQSFIRLPVLKQMYDQPFCVWRYGPVVEPVYEEYKVCGSDPIIQSSKQEPILKPLNTEIVRLLKTDPFVLIQRSQCEPFWQKHQDDIIGWRSNTKYSLYNVRTGGYQYVQD